MRPSVVLTISAASLVELCLAASAKLAVTHPSRSLESHFPSSPRPLRHNTGSVFNKRSGNEDDADGPAAEEENPPDTRGYFEQLLDHNNASAGTFMQRFWWNADHYKSPGSPIILNAPSEYNAENDLSYLLNATLPGLYAQSVGGATILLEHRYAGGSSPVDQLTGKGMEYLNIDNTIHDMINFAKNAMLPFDQSNSSRPDRAPWVLVGCSWSGSLTAWTSKLAPDTFWAYHAASAPVQAISNFWQYYEPAELALPRNCSADYKRIVAHVDRVFGNSTAEERLRFKERFGFGDLEHDDFASVIPGGLSEHQYPGMCDYIENQWPGSNALAAGPEGVGLEKALDGFARWTSDVLIPGFCASTGLWPEDDNKTFQCWNTYDASSPIYQDKGVNNSVNRLYLWMNCNEPFENWQAWGPGADSGLVPEIYSGNTWRRQCDMYLPEAPTYGLKQGRTVNELNNRTGGWDYTDSKRLMWSNGEFDPWRAASVSSDRRPRGPLQSTKEAPVWVIPKGTQCGDQWTGQGEENPEVKKVMDAEVAHIKEWVDEFYKLNVRTP